MRLVTVSADIISYICIGSSLMKATISVAVLLAGEKLLNVGLFEVASV